MRPEELVQSRQMEWKSLTGLLARAARGVERLSSADIILLSRLYRTATSDLALAQRDFPNLPVTVYLNQLTARAHAVIYRSEPMVLRRIGAFFTGGFPRLFRDTWQYHLVSALLLFLPLFTTGMVTASHPGAATWVLPPGSESLVQSIEQKQLWTDIPIEERPYASSGIMTNNIRIAVLAFGGGMLAGLPTVYVLCSNGLMTGGIVGLTFHYGIGMDLLTFMIGHGVIELSVICISGGCGFMLAWAILQPGLLRRRDALRLAAQKSARLLLGCLLLLVLAGIIEGFISPSAGVTAAGKWLIGGMSGVLLYAYLLGGGRVSKPRAAFEVEVAVDH